MANEGFWNSTLVRSSIGWNVPVWPNAALSDALDLRGMERIDLGVGIAAFLGQHPLGQPQGAAEGIAQVLVVGRLAADVAGGAPEIGFELAHGPVRPLVLFRIPLGLGELGFFERHVKQPGSALRPARLGRFFSGP